MDFLLRFSCLIQSIILSSSYKSVSSFIYVQIEVGGLILLHTPFTMDSLHREILQRLHSF